MAARSYIGAAYIRNTIGSTEYAAFITAATTATQLIQAASAKVASALIKSGYTPPSDSDPPIIIKEATMGMLIKSMYRRKGVPVPEEWDDMVGIANDIYNGRLPIEELTPDAANAVGGSRWTDSSSTVANGGKPAVYKNLRKYY